jgi:SAM-dependent methyltransferase
LTTTDLPALETVAFIEAHVAFRPARILEVGCGNGAVAAHLKSNGHEVIAIDSDSKAIARAREQGVDARVASWPDFDAPSFDMVLFTRSLHHIKPLPESITRAKQVLRSGGRVLVEDFAFEEMDTRCHDWLYSHLARLDAAGLLRRPGDGLAEKLLEHHGSHDASYYERDHDLHTAPAMLACLREHFSRVDEMTTPYLYRYVCAILEDTARGYAEAAEILELEKRFAQTQDVPLIGRRFVPYDS